MGKSLENLIDFLRSADKPYITPPEQMAQDNLTSINLARASVGKPPLKEWPPVSDKEDC